MQRMHASCYQGHFVTVSSCACESVQQLTLQISAQGFVSTQLTCVYKHSFVTLYYPIQGHLAMPQRQPYLAGLIEPRWEAFCKALENTSIRPTADTIKKLLEMVALLSGTCASLDFQEAQSFACMSDPCPQSF
eukprot:786235-Pelagomonas_calceolata.AAC.3